ncbi:Dipeptide transport system permease protein dppB,nickel transporter permease NikB,nickel ABC transporter, permease subunit NikB,Binding-protein-dependent transport system inner membrane component [Chlamydia serpentis]|uniref:Dipeptide transport system permease protein dppB,nickel transporter permease NikB,nickel ABC transporter, permease subunit NikB,Binding-protein-dependent transport system inner membrane component n=1 Tax=Chlamydia serpentis TaxID=1967782 RepID=A0A2R8FBC6_9CHLA|nr:ABC transporter permease [Chlamydia serpentis]SPN73718.1 Dipeptide transport system permease protein dppB,nickel transporter permease NikB,nickel ABC transporter, permease subunit NikB,Binding-protein-dependent transport system inner membrane component [Chlamydia serpentis]
MLKYILKRLILIPLTLFAIVSINFLILNAAPGDVLEEKAIDSLGEAGKSDKIRSYKGPDRYLQFREHYGLTLPIFFNTRPKIPHKKVRAGLEDFFNYANNKITGVANVSKSWVYWGDCAKFIMPVLLFEADDTSRDSKYRHLAADLFIRGGVLQGIVGPNLSLEERAKNKEIAESNAFLLKQLSEEDINAKVEALKSWFQDHGGTKVFCYNSKQACKIFFCETRFFRYMSRVLRLDFGTLRNDSHKTVISEVIKRLRCSLVLSILPMIVGFVLCQFFGMIMALKRNHWIDHSLNFIFLILFSIPVFVAVPWILDNFVINKTIPFTSAPMPYSGLHSPPEVFNELSTLGRLFDLLSHGFLPFCAVSYGALAAQSRLSRSIFLEVLGQDFICAAKARGVRWIDILYKHVGKNAAVSIVTSLASSLGTLLGGALVVETLFDIDGFGNFFYQAILNRDHNVVLFSVLVGSTLSLVGYLLGDICYVLLDPRVQLEGRRL